MFPLCHFFFGYSLTLLALTLVIISRKSWRNWLIKGEHLNILIFISILGGIFAELPDLECLIGGLYGLHESILGEICFLHVYLDALAPENDLMSLYEMTYLFLAVNFHVVLLIYDPLNVRKGLDKDWEDVHYAP